MTLNVTKLNNAIKVGSIIPMKQKNGNIGRWLEKELRKSGYTVNTGKGIDLKKLGIEVKTRTEGSTSGHTVGAMLPHDIVQQDWTPGNNMFDKIQRQFRVYHKVNELTGYNIVTSALIHDFTDEKIQTKLKESWDHCRAYLVQNTGLTPEYIRGQNKWAYLELQENGYYQFRITPGYMKEMENITNLNRTKLFFIGA